MDVEEWGVVAHCLCARVPRLKLLTSCPTHDVPLGQENPVARS
jgi:hypothetical protein